MTIKSQEIVEISKKAGNAIMKIYNEKQLANQVEYKSDDSPLTLADKKSHEVIIQELKKLTPDTPILSEESKEVNYFIRRNWNMYWLVDPLDGTREFINRNGEFTVNIALIQNRVPVFGVVHVPVKDITYWGKSNDQAFKLIREDQVPISVNNNKNNLTAVKSRSHGSEEEIKILDEFNVTNEISVGSSLKFCMVAEGSADIYYRHGPTMEWDTAAGHAIVLAAGGSVYNGSKIGDPFLYNKEQLLNNSFLCVGF